MGSWRCHHKQPTSGVSTCHNVAPPPDPSAASQPWASFLLMLWVLLLLVLFLSCVIHALQYTWQILVCNPFQSLCARLKLIAPSAKVALPSQDQAHGFSLLFPARQKKPSRIRKSWGPAPCCYLPRQTCSQSSEPHCLHQDSHWGFIPCSWFLLNTPIHIHRNQ